MQGLKGPLLQSQVPGAVEGWLCPGMVSRDQGAHSRFCQHGTKPHGASPSPMTAAVSGCWQHGPHHYQQGAALGRAVSLGKPTDTGHRGVSQQGWCGQDCGQCAAHSTVVAVPLHRVAPPHCTAWGTTNIPALPTRGVHGQVCWGQSHPFLTLLPTVLPVLTVSPFPIPM